MLLAVVVMPNKSVANRIQTTPTRVDCVGLELRINTRHMPVEYSQMNRGHFVTSETRSVNLVSVSAWQILVVYSHRLFDFLLHSLHFNHILFYLNWN